MNNSALEFSAAFLAALPDPALAVGPDLIVTAANEPMHLLLETEAKLSKASPLVIKGPQVGAGQLLLVLIVQ